MYCTNASGTGVHTSFGQLSGAVSGLRIQHCPVNTLHCKHVNILEPISCTFTVDLVPIQATSTTV